MTDEEPSIQEILGEVERLKADLEDTKQRLESEKNLNVDLQRELLKRTTVPKEEEPKPAEKTEEEKAAEEHAKMVEELAKLTIELVKMRK